MAKVTAASVNRMLKTNGVQERLQRDSRGWFTFSLGESGQWESNIVPVRSASQLTLEQWWEQYLLLKNS